MGGPEVAFCRAVGRAQFRLCRVRFGSDPPPSPASG